MVLKHELIEPTNPGSWNYQENPSPRRKDHGGGGDLPKGSCGSGT